ncbi:MAG: menaquinone biosynthesis protein [Bacteroidales bacterium]|nr:menaquinone biosynthesis protein [Bacteroidales bacterium]
MDKIKIVAVSYYNTLPMLYGLENSDFIKNNCEILLKYPSECARMLVENECDISLIPVGAIPRLTKPYKIISDYCIGAENKVRTVLLVSDSPIEKVKGIYLDYQSATSVRLIKILAKYFWKISPEWLKTEPEYENNIEIEKAGIIIGDRCFTKRKYKYEYDLAEEWIKFTGFPFVFASWVTTKDLSSDFKQKFNEAIKIGVSDINKVINFYKNKFIKEFEPLEYYTKNISFYLSEQKVIGMNKFLEYLKSNL